MIDLIILNSGKENSDGVSTRDSCAHVKNAFFLNNLSDIKNIDFSTDYYIILYDDEVLSQVINNILNVYLEQDFDFIECFRIETVDDHPKITFAPRIFKKGICPSDKCLLPENFTQYKITRMLDAYIYEKEFYEALANRPASLGKTFKDVMKNMIKPSEKAKIKINELSGTDNKG
jgi:hypothetical protein